MFRLRYILQCFVFHYSFAVFVPLHCTSMCFTVESQMQKLQHSIQFALYFVRSVKDKGTSFMLSNRTNSDNIVGNQDKMWEPVLVNQINLWSYKLSMQGEGKMHGQCNGTWTYTALVQEQMFYAFRSVVLDLRSSEDQRKCSISTLTINVGRCISEQCLTR